MLSKILKNNKNLRIFNFKKLNKRIFRLIENSIQIHYILIQSPIYLL
jgi:hypothetical protein